MDILLVEDNQTIAKGLVYSFEKNNYSVKWAGTCREAKEHLTKEHLTEDYLSKDDMPRLVILDVALPDGNGFDLYEKVIKEMSVPTIFLTAKDDEDDIVKGLELGGEDYITKPFSTKELLARVSRTLLRHKKNNQIRVKDITFDLDKMEVFREEEKIELTALEIKLLNLLFTNAGKVVSRNVILDRIWEWTGNDVDDHTVTVYFKRIREKLVSDIIITVKGLGYRIDNE